MKGFKFYDSRMVGKFFTPRKGEKKFGEKISFVPGLEDLAKSTARYVLFGIPEDIGIRANMGKAGAAKSWSACLGSLLNTQDNRYNNPQNVILLGEIDCRDLMEKAARIDENDPNYYAKLGDLVAELDAIVSKIITAIVSAGKIPIVIGGGHNNAFGNIKGSSIAVGKPVNIMNIDAHTDLRSTEHRHSGNGFSFARKENYLGKYRMFGIHQNYTPEYIFEQIYASPNDQYRLFEHLILKSSQEILEAFKEELSFASQEEFGLELDCDSIRDFPSSAQTPSGFPFNMVRNFITIAAEEEKIKYLHICEAAAFPGKETEIGKALSYLITDFIRPSS